MTALEAGIPPKLDLPDGYKITWAALDPASGADVGGVVVSGVSIFGRTLGVGGGVLAPPPPPPSPTGPPPPPVPPPTIGGVDPDPFRWDATIAQLDPNSAALAQAFVGYALSSGAFVHPNVAYAVVPKDGAGTYPVSTAGKPGLLDATIHVPNGTLAGTSTDHHLTIVDWHTGRQHDLWEAVVTAGKLTGWRGGCSIPIGAIQQPRGPNSSSNAALLNGMGGVLRPEQVSAHDLAHPLVFACPKPGTGITQRYPSNALKGWTDTAGGGPYPTHLAQAAWLRFPPGLAFPAMDSLSLYLCKRIQARGMFLSDRNTNDLNFKSADLGGGGRSLAAWRAAGVNLSSLPNFSLRLSAAIPWGKLQLLVPPHA